MKEIVKNKVWTPIPPKRTSVTLCWKYYILLLVYPVGLC